MGQGICSACVYNMCKGLGRSVYAVLGIEFSFSFPPMLLFKSLHFSAHSPFVPSNPNPPFDKVWAKNIPKPTNKKTGRSTEILSFIILSWYSWILNMYIFRCLWTFSLSFWLHMSGFVTALVGYACDVFSHCQAHFLTNLITTSVILTKAFAALGCAQIVW